MLRKIAISMDPGNYYARFSYAALLEDMKRYDEAEEEYLKAANIRAGE